MSKSHIEALKQLEASSSYQAVLPLIGSILYLADQVERLQEEKQDKPSSYDSEIDDQNVLVQSEMEKNFFPLVKIPSLWGGDFQGMWIYRAMPVFLCFASA